MIHKQEYKYNALITRIIDGDTYDAIVDLGFKIAISIRIRLHNFDTPELRSMHSGEVVHAKAARDFVEQTMPVGTMVVIASVKSAVYNRWEADVWLTKEDASVSDEGTLVVTKESVSLATLLADAGFAKKDSYPLPTPAPTEVIPAP